MSRLVRLPSGMILDLDRVIFIVKNTATIGQYQVVMSGLGDIAPTIDGKDLDVLLQSGKIEVIHEPLT